MYKLYYINIDMRLSQMGGDTQNGSFHLWEHDFYLWYFEVYSPFSDKPVFYNH